MNNRQAAGILVSAFAAIGAYLTGIVPGVAELAFLGLAKGLAFVATQAGAMSAWLHRQAHDESKRITWGLLTIAALGIAAWILIEIRDTLSIAFLLLLIAIPLVLGLAHWLTPRRNGHA